MLYLGAKGQQKTKMNWCVSSKTTSQKGNGKKDAEVKGGPLNSEQLSWSTGKANNRMAKTVDTLMKAQLLSDESFLVLVRSQTFSPEQSQPRVQDS